MNQTIYFPALGASYMCGVKKDIKHLNGKSFRYFHKSNGLINYGRTLITAGHFYKDNLKEILDLDFDNDIILGDSGGFQLSTGAVQYSDDIVKTFFNWLENNTNYAMNLDFPPYIKKFTGQVEEGYDQKEYFEDKLKLSQKHFDYFHQNQSGKTKYLKVLHGRDLKELDKWYNGMKDFYFDGGWSIGSLSTRSTSDIYLVLLTFFYLFEQGELDKKYCDKLALLHFLGFSKIATLPVVFYLQKILNERKSGLTISFDSSSPFLTSAYGNYWFYIGNSGAKNLKITQSSLKTKDQMNLDQSLPCSCPVCKGLTFKDLYNFSNEGESFKTEFYMYLSLHNIYTFLKYKYNIESIINLNSKEINEEFFDAKIIKLFKIIDQAILNSSPLNYIRQSQKEIINLDEEPTTQQTTIKKFII